MRKTTQKSKIAMNRDTVIPYQELINLYVRECKMKNLSEITIKGYLTANKYFLDYAGENLTTEDVTQDILDDYKMFLIEKFKPETVNTYIFKVSPVVKFGISSWYIKENIIFNHMIEQERFKEIYSDEELRKLLIKLKDGSFAEFRNWVIINFLLGTGMRAMELRELNIKDVDLDNNIISLSHTKNRKIRVIPISSSLHNVLYEYIYIRNGKTEEPLFCNQYGEALCRTTLQVGITKYCKKRNINKYSLHLFRHTFITLSIRNGVSPHILKRITGHSSFKMLDNYYNAEISDIVNIVDDINPLERFKQKGKISMR